MGYHKKNIKKGKVGDFSKIVEEYKEVKDAHLQGARIMELLELSDLLGAIDLYLEKNFPSFSVFDLIHMSNLTHSAFKDGDR